jgi:DNA processing protein
MKEISSQEYFPSAQKIPEKLYLRGELPPLNTKFITVVGTRKPSAYGLRTTKKLIAGLRNLPVSIVSGLALGIDTIAHESALENNLHTIAIPGSSLEESKLYPRTNIKLAENILASGGALLSPWKEQQSAPWTFPARNGIMAAIANLVLVIECAEDSGTMITARESIKRGSPLAAVPGDIDALTSLGPNKLIKEGAHLVRSADDIIELLHLNKMQPIQQSLPLRNFDHPLLIHINGPTSRDTIIEISGLSTQEVFTGLALLELEGVIAVDSNGFVSRI